MKVKIGDKIYTPEKDGPIMIILTEKDKDNIKNMHDNANRYCVFDEKKVEPKEVKTWMENS